MCVKTKATTNGNVDTCVNAKLYFISVKHKIQNKIEPQKKNSIILISKQNMNSCNRNK